MLNRLQTFRKKSEGFTIIEVLIVLAIAALILVIVLIAIPQLQRNQRNTARKASASRLAAEIGNYIGNNNGVPPNSAATDFTAPNANSIGTPKFATGFFGRYLGCTTTNNATAASCTTDINDPSYGVPMGTGTNGMSTTDTAACVVGGTPPGANPGALCYATSQLCNGETTQAGTARNYVLLVRLEGNSVACFDNG